MTWQEVVEGVREEFLQSHYARVGAIVILLLGAASAGYFGYHWYIQQREERAQLVFAAAVDLAQQALKAESDQEGANVTWHDVEMAFKIGYDQNKSSYLAPYFLAFQAEAAARQARPSEALDLMNQSLTVLAVDDPLYDQYCIKRACMKLDSDNEQLKQEGIKELRSVAAKQDSLFQEPALYYLGEYYWSLQQFEDARDVWLTLVKEVKEGQSVWKEAALAKLNQL